MDTKYALVTPAKNEEAFIERTLSSVVAQSVKPVQWIIVSDGSTDRTDEIVRQYAEKHAFIQLLRREGSGRNFGNKVYAFQEGYKALQSFDFNFIGNLDADIELPPNYYESVLAKFNADKQLGLAGGARLDFCNGEFVEIRCAKNSVGGPFQLFRRSVYDAIGGYIPLKLGGIDAVAEIMVRQHGWTVRTFTEIVSRHYRCTGTAKGSRFKASFRGGKKLYVIGYHPLFELVKLMKVSGIKNFMRHCCELAGYTMAAVFRYERQVPDDFVKYLRQEQLDRLMHLIRYRKDPAKLTGTIAK